MGGRLLTTTGLALAVVLLFAINILAGTSLGWLRMDLTENGLYTLSDGTRNILAKLEEPITLRLYVSERQLPKIPAIASYSNRVRTLLREFERRSGGKVVVHSIDPEPFSEEEDRAVAYGLRGLPLGAEDETLYFGLVGTNSVDAEEAIPFLSTEREEFLEYDVTKLVYNLSNSKRPVVGLMSSLPIEGSGGFPMRGGGQDAWMVVDQMRQLFDVRSLRPDVREIPADTGVLLLVHPQKLPDAALYAIDQFVLRGGRVVAFVDPYAESQPAQAMGGFMAPPTDRRSDIDRLLTAWGVKLEPDTVVADLATAVTVRMDRQGRIFTFEYPVWMNVQPEQMDHEDIVTANLGNVAFGTAGSLVALEGAKTTFSPLVRTTRQATTFPPARIDQVQDPRELLRTYAPADREYVVAARVSGRVATAFPDGAPAAAEEAKEGASSPAKEDAPKPAAAHLAESSEDANLVIVADADLLADRFWVVVQNFLGSRLAVPSAANGALVVNAIDNLSGSSDLISVRNRGSFVRPFDRVNELKREAELGLREKEQELSKRLEEAEKKLVELEERKQGDEAAILSDAQRQALVQFREERLRIRRELRDVRHALRRNIESLEGWLKFANIGLVPILIALAGVLSGVVRMRRRRVGLVEPVSAS